MKRFDPFDGYTINVVWDDDGEYLAHFVELANISAFGESPEDALRELQTAWEGVKESYQKHGEPVPVAPARKEYSGQLMYELIGGCTALLLLRLPRLGSR